MKIAAMLAAITMLGGCSITEEQREAREYRDAEWRAEFLAYRAKCRNDGGRLVVPVGPRETQVLKIVQRRGDRTFAHELKGACFVPLIGRHGWEEMSS